MFYDVLEKDNGRQGHHGGRQLRVCRCRSDELQAL